MNAVIGVDPGWRWTAGILLVGDDVIDGFTLGPIGSRKANDAMDPAALDAYTDRIGAALDELWDQAVALGHTPRVAVEMPTVPIGNKRFVAKFRAYKITNDVAWFVKGRFNATRIRNTDNFGHRHEKARGGSGIIGDYYPASLIRRRQLRGPCQAPDGERNHERAAYDVAMKIRQLETAAA